MAVIVEESTKFSDQDGIPFSIGIAHSQLYGADVIRIEEQETNGDDCWIEMSLEAAELAVPVLQKLIAELKARTAPKPTTKPKK